MRIPSYTGPIQPRRNLLHIGSENGGCPFGWFEGKQEAKRLSGSPNLETHLDAIEEWPMSEGRLRAASSETYPYSSSVSCLQPGPGRNWQRETTNGRPLTKLVDSLE